MIFTLWEPWYFPILIDLVEVRIHDDVSTALVPNALPVGIPLLLDNNTSGFSSGTGFNSAAIDLSAYAGQDIPIRISFTLNGRGLLPSSIPGLRPDDFNPMDSDRGSGNRPIIG